MYAIEATREVAAEFGDGVVHVEVVTLKELAGAERYRELRRLAGEHLPVPSVLLRGRLVSPGIPEQDELRQVFEEALAAAYDATHDFHDNVVGIDAGGPPC